MQLCAQSAVPRDRSCVSASATISSGSRRIMLTRRPAMCADTLNWRRRPNASAKAVDAMINEARAAGAVIADRLGRVVATVFADKRRERVFGQAEAGLPGHAGRAGAGRPTAVLTWHTDRLHRSPAELEDHVTVCERRVVLPAPCRPGCPRRADQPRGSPGLPYQPGPLRRLPRQAQPGSPPVITLDQTRLRDSEGTPTSGSGLPGQRQAVRRPGERRQPHDRSR